MVWVEVWVDVEVGVEVEVEVGVGVEVVVVVVVVVVVGVVVVVEVEVGIGVVVVVVMQTNGTPPGTLLLASSRCPWCASMPRVANPDDMSARWLVLCPNKECPVQPFAAGETQEEAVGKWCRRAN